MASCPSMPRRLGRAALTLVAGIALSATLTACVERGHALLRHAETDLPGQILRGTLIERGVCIGVASPDTGWTVIVWPFASGSTRSRDLIRVGIDGTSVRLGDAVALEGGFADPGTQIASLIRTRHLEERCPAVRYFLVADVVEHAPA